MEMGKLIGMTEAKGVLERIVKNSDAYKKGKAKVPNFFITMEPGDGQTTLTETITDLFENNRLREFHGLDDYKEYKLDGTMQNLKVVFADIRDNAVYENDYKGVVSFDVTRLSNNTSSYEMRYFEENLVKVAETATIIIYCSKQAGSKREKIKERICNLIDNVEVIEEYQYSPNDFAKIVVQKISERGIAISEEKELVETISEVILDKEIKTVKESIALVDSFVFYADYSGKIPVLELDKEMWVRKIYKEA